MSGAFAKTHRTIWRDPDFRDLTIWAQWLYWHLFSSPRLTWCGVLDWKPRAVLKATQSLTQDALEDALHELRESYFIVLDDDTEELIVRSFVRSDAVHKQPKLMSALSTAFAGIESDLIAGVLSWELQRLKSEEPNLAGWGEVEKVLRTPPCNPSSIPLPERVSPGVSVGVSEKGMAKGSTDNYTSPTPTPTPQQESSRTKPKVPLPDDWSPTDTHRAKARELSLDIDSESEKFMNHHQSKDNRYVDWNKAFHTWLRQGADYAKRTPPPRQSAADRAMQRGAERHQQIENGQLGNAISWDDVFPQTQIER